MASRTPSAERVVSRTPLTKSWHSGQLASPKKDSVVAEPSGAAKRSSADVMVAIIFERVD